MIETGGDATDPWPDGHPAFGATVDRDGTTFAVWAPMARQVELCLFNGGAEKRLPLPERTFGTWHGHVPGVGPGQQYGYRVTGTWDPVTGHRFNAAKLLADPYARALTGAFVDHDAVYAHSRRSGDDTVRDDHDSAPYVPRSVVVADDFDWGGVERPRVPWGDTVLYELHVRGFTMRHPKVPPEQRGTYAGLAHPAVLEELVGLGVTTVELLPIHHFVSEPALLHRGLSNYWGYNSLGFFAPHAAYSASGSLGQQVTEFKAMVRALHEAGLEVVLDVVYNHTGEQNEAGPTLSYRGLHNPAYYRLRDHGRRALDHTGTGNTLNLRNPHVVRLVTDSMRYWVEEMHVDGFRFDLAPALTRASEDVDVAGPFLTVVGQDPVLSKVKLIAEPWDLGPGGYQLGAFPPPWSEWNDRYRDALRDFWRGVSPGGLWDLAYRLSGSSDRFRHNGRRPFASVNFVTAHDGFTLRDLVSYDRKHNDANGEHNRDGTDDNRSWNGGVEGETSDPAVNALRQRQARNLLASLLLSAGVPMLVAGDERGRTQRGNNNAYCQDNEISWLDWAASEPGWSELPSFVRTVLQLRREHPVFRRPRFFSGRLDAEQGRRDVGWFGPWGREMDHEAWHNPQLLTLGMFFAGDRTGRRLPNGEPVLDDSFLLWLHAGPAPVEAVLPDRPWAEAYELVLDTSAEVTTTHARAGDHLLLPARSVVLLRAS